MPSSTGWFSEFTIVHANSFGKGILSGTPKNLKRQINGGHYELGNIIAILVIHIRMAFIFSFSSILKSIVISVTVFFTSSIYFHVLPINLRYRLLSSIVLFHIHT